MILGSFIECLVRLRGEVVWNGSGFFSLRPFLKKISYFVKNNYYNVFKKHLLPKLESDIHSDYHNLWRTIHSASEEFWKLSLNVGDERNLLSFVSEESGLLNGLDISNRQTNLPKQGNTQYCINSTLRSVLLWSLMETGNPPPGNGNHQKWLPAWNEGL